MAMADLIAKNSMRSAAETRAGIMTIILVSSMVFLLLPGGTACYAVCRGGGPDIARLKSVIDDPGRTWGTDTDRLAPLPGQATIAIPVTPDGRHDPMLALLGVNASTAEDTQGRFIIRDGALFAAMRNNESVVISGGGGVEANRCFLPLYLLPDDPGIYSQHGRGASGETAIGLENHRSSWLRAGSRLGQKHDQNAERPRRGRRYGVAARTSAGVGLACSRASRAALMLVGLRPLK
jgi:hypothetical protein